MKTEIKIGIPNGSTLEANRGGLKNLLENARIRIEDIDSKKAPRAVNIPWLSVMMQRPQELPYLSDRGYCDAFFAGDDWATEWNLRGYKSEKILGLGISKVKIVSATIPNKKDFRVIASEYPNIAKNYLEEKFDTKDVEIAKNGKEVTAYYSVVESFGKTELKIEYGIADLVVENTQSGRTLNELGMVVLDEIMESECGLYVPSRLVDKDKMKKIERVAMMLEGAKNSKDKDLITFNVEKKYLEKVINYVKINELYGNEETVIKGRNNYQITLQVETNNSEKPLLDIIWDLKGLGARSIEGIPLSYSIK